MANKRIKLSENLGAYVEQAKSMVPKLEKDLSEIGAENEKLKMEMVEKNKQIN